jgi:nucleoside-diphosphate-sugar epimerase
MNYGTWYNVPYAITYFYNVYGPREIQTGKYATLIALFKEKMKNGENLTIVSPGTQKETLPISMILLMDLCWLVKMVMAMSLG